MRKQYHFRPSEQGLLVWDIHRLIVLSKEFPIIEVPLAEIKELDQEFWFEEAGNRPTCRNIAEHAKLMRDLDMGFPIILFSDGKVADGMHRVCRAWMDGEAAIKAVRFAIDPEPDYVGVDPKDLPY